MMRDLTQKRVGLLALALLGAMLLFPPVTRTVRESSFDPRSMRTTYGPAREEPAGHRFLFASPEADDDGDDWQIDLRRLAVQAALVLVVVAAARMFAWRREAS